MALEFKLDFPQDASLKSGEEKGKLFDLAILGGGPAGLTSAVYAMRKQLDTVLISPDMGGQVLWSSGVENYMGYQYITGPELANKFSSQTRQFPIKLALGEQVKEISPEAGVWTVRTDTGREIRSRCLILATGKRPRRLEVPGEKEWQGKGVSYCAICDGPFFRSRPVLIAGGGNSAVSAALDMLELGSKVTMINLADGWQADPVLLRQIEGRAVLLDSHRFLEVTGEAGKMTGARIAPRDGGPEQWLPAEGVFVEIGLYPNTELFRGLVDLNARGEVITDCYTRTSRPGVFAAGDCTHMPDKQIIIAAGDGAKAALAAYRYIKNIPA
jgi:alkyl hydroperoxide reductase subunit F